MRSANIILFPLDYDGCIYNPVFQILLANLYLQFKTIFYPHLGGRCFPHCREEVLEEIKQNVEIGALVQFIDEFKIHHAERRCPYDSLEALQFMMLLNKLDASLVTRIIVKANKKLLAHMAAIVAEQNPDYIYIALGSNRQALINDLLGIQYPGDRVRQSGSGSAFLDLIVLQQALSHLVGKPCHLYKFTLPDAYHGLAPGTNYNQILRFYGVENESVEGVQAAFSTNHYLMAGEINTRQQCYTGIAPIAVEASLQAKINSFFPFKYDVTKFSLLYCFAHSKEQLAREVGVELENLVLYLHFYDDLDKEILKPLHAFTRENLDLIPQQTFVRLHNYKKGEVYSSFPVLKGSGIQDHHWAESLRRMVRLASGSFEINYCDKKVDIVKTLDVAAFKAYKHQPQTNLPHQLFNTYLPAAATASSSTPKIKGPR